MRQAEIYYNKILAGLLTENDNGEYIFRYDDKYFQDSSLPAISLTLPKTKPEYKSETLFSFFFNMLSEGANKAIQCQTLRIDEEDYFGLLLATAHTDTIGAVTVKKI
jgi:HipA-like protein